MNDLTRFLTHYRFDVELGNRGQWYATSPDVEGLLVIGYSLADCLSEIGPALERASLALVTK
jgi:hypothetical protein